MDKRKIVKIAGLAVALFTVFSLVSAVSYLFTWKADQSVIVDPQRLDPSVEVANAGGKTGAGWGWLLVSRWFGLGSFALILALAVMSCRMLFGRRNFSAAKTIALALTAGIVSSFVLAFISVHTGLDNVFGGGLGGDCGNVVIGWSENLFGFTVTFFALAVLIVLWFVFASRRFSDWFMSLGEKKAADVGKERTSAREHEAAAADSGADAPARVRRGFTWLKKELSDEAGETPGPEESADAESGSTPGDEDASSESEVSLGADDVEVQVAELAADNAVTTSVATEKAAGRSAGGGAAVSGDAVASDGKTIHGNAGDDEGLEVVEGEELSTEVVEELPRIDVRDELRDYRFPPLELLDDYENLIHKVPQEELKRNNYKIRATLKTYKIDVDNVKAVVGPTVTLYKVYPAPGVKISAIKNLQEDIAMALHAKGVRIATLDDSVGIEVANDQPSIVPLKAMLNDPSFRDSKAELPVAIGYTITQKVKVFDLADAPHLLVAGATKQGKSVGLNVLISSLLYSKHPSELKFVFIDPKMVEFSAYARLIKHYLAELPNALDEADEYNKAICKDARSAELILRSLCQEMDERYELMGKALVNKVTLYNDRYKNRYLLPTEGHRYMPYIVVVVDEYADLTMSVGGSGDAKALARSISTSIIRLAQKGRAAGIHVVLATQRPSVDVVTGLIKSNFPTRIAFRVFSAVDSKTILDSTGAEKLIGKGDMIYSAGADMERIQCAFISNDEINDITNFIGEQKGYRKSYNTPYYLPEPESEGDDSPAMVDMKHLDERFEEAARQVVMSQRGSTSDLQRRLGMGYAKAGRVMDQLEAAGIVGPQEGSKPRQVLVSNFDELQKIIDAFKNNQA